MAIPDLRWQLAARCAPRLRLQPPAAWRRDGLTAVRASSWFTALALLLLCGLLFAFQQVVVQAVHRGEALRASAAAQIEVAWRCQNLTDPGNRRRCLVQLDGRNAAPGLHATATPKEN
jgi:hypothetical protein